MQPKPPFMGWLWITLDFPSLLSIDGALFGCGPFLKVSTEQMGEKTSMYPVAFRNMTFFYSFRLISHFLASVLMWGLPQKSAKDRNL